MYASHIYSKPRVTPEATWHKGKKVSKMLVYPRNRAKLCGRHPSDVSLCEMTVSVTVNGLRCYRLYLHEQHCNNLISQTHISQRGSWSWSSASGKLLEEDLGVITLNSRVAFDSSSFWFEHVQKLNQWWSAAKCCSAGSDIVSKITSAHVSPPRDVSVTVGIT